MKKTWKNAWQNRYCRVLLMSTFERALWRDIEVVITRRSWKPFVRKGAWVRIPPPPFQEFRRCGTPFCITGDGKMTQKIKHYICEKDGRIKWQFRLILSAAILSIMLAESRFLYYHSPKDTKWLICIIYALTGYYCPGCGAGRACYCILHGQIYQAFRYNPLLVLLLPWIGAYLHYARASGYLQVEKA